MKLGGWMLIILRSLGEEETQIDIVSILTIGGALYSHTHILTRLAWYGQHALGGGGHLPSSFA